MRTTNCPQRVKSKRVTATIVLSIFTSACLFASPVWADSDATQPYSNTSVLDKAKALSAQGKHNDAFKLLKTIPKSESSYLAMITNLASIDLDDAEETADEAVGAFPNSAELHFLRGVIMGNQAQSSIFSALSYAEKSLNSFVKASQLEPTEIKYRKSLMSFYLVAPSIAGGDEKLALEQLKAIQDADPFEGTSSQVMFFRMSGQAEKAEEALVQAISTYPDEISFVFQLASFYAQEEKYVQAMPLFQKAANMPSPEFAINETTGESEDIFVRNASAKLNALYQIGRTAVLSEKNTAEGLAAMAKLQAAVEHSKLDNEQLPNMEWAKARIAELHIQSGDKKAASELLAKIAFEGNKDLKKQVKKLKKRL
jgi:tetratricopeptide (TPR) repeat protein